ncbi:hypothetical protein EBB59_05530 [Lysobacter pythonis]|uniref:Uncharacterized protein n=1 Tax=Solilutibacter pythonis TaxID=2483112 RepID=A0A3M2I511_9GAMM|nr:hypothetical protein EBB59_05530 [Lysobacter pythonis]
MHMMQWLSIHMTLVLLKHLSGLSMNRKPLESILDIFWVERIYGKHSVVVLQLLWAIIGILDQNAQRVLLQLLVSLRDVSLQSTWDIGWDGIQTSYLTGYSARFLWI